VSKPRLNWYVIYTSRDGVERIRAAFSHLSDANEFAGRASYNDRWHVYEVVGREWAEAQSTAGPQPWSGC